MANAWTIDKLPEKTKKALVKDILAGMPDKQIAANYGIASNCVLRYRQSKLFKAVAEVWAERHNDVAQAYEDKLEAIAVRLGKVLDSIDRELSNPNGEYDLSDARKAYPYIKMLNDTAKTLQANIGELARIKGLVKDTVAIQHSPTVILAQIGQVIQQAADKGEIIDRLKQLRQVD